MNRLLLFLMLSVFSSACSEDDTAIQPEDYSEFVDGEITHQGNQRRFILRVPSNYDGTRALPLVIFLHGGGGNAESAQGFTSFNQVSEENDFLVAYPQAFYESEPNSFVWADGRGLAPDLLGIDDVGYIDALTTYLKNEYNVNAKRVYLCGFSNGSFLTQRIAFEKSDQFAAIGTLGGTMNENLFKSEQPERAIPMMYVFGTDDPFVPYDGGFVSGNPNLDPVTGIEDAVDYWRQHNQCSSATAMVSLPDLNTNDNSMVEVYEYTDCACNATVKFYRIVGGGHTWPGVKVPNQPDLGETNLDILASEELWNFFLKHELCN